MMMVVRRKIDVDWSREDPRNEEMKDWKDWRDW